MLRLNNIVKDYHVADETVHALKGVSINFRQQEFVSILGPSGCGKTTLLNIIGGLDQYTNGDLIINGVSTKNFKDRDWDIYRNHRIGFVFQSYNLIPHQNVLSNVELALTIAGMSKAERIKKAKDALDKVGLKGQYNKKPNQLSGGQCQRVAIARAIVNDPEILLADEPTGALDTVTSVQIMDIIKEISKERLVIMVTHNPELAEKYSTRIINLLDGEVLKDSNPYSDTLEEEENKLVEVKETNKKENKKAPKEKAKMSLFTAFRLSGKNLFSKLKRTILVIIAGSIGIIGVSSVLAVSSGISEYIENMQDDLLSGNPMRVNESGVDMATMMNGMSFEDKGEIAKQVINDGASVNIKSIIDILVSQEKALMDLVYTNTIDEDYLNFILSMPKEYYNDISMKYGLDLTQSVYTMFNAFDGKYEEYSRMMSLQSITETYRSMLEQTEYSEYASYITSLQTPLGQGLSNMEYVSGQYDLLYGRLPEKKEDILVVVSDDNSLSDLLLAQLGYVSEEQFYNWIYRATPDMFESSAYNPDIDVMSISYEDICNKDFYWFPNDLIYNDRSFTANDMFVQAYDYNYEMKPTWTVGDEINQGIKLNVCGIVKAKDNYQYGSLSTGFLYSEDLSREIIRRNINSTIAKNIREHGSVASMSYTYSTTIMGFIPVTKTIEIGISYDLKYIYSHGSNVFVEGNLPVGSEETETNGPMKKVFVGSSSTGIMSTALSYVMSGGGKSDRESSSDSSSSDSASMISQYMNMKTMSLSNVGGSIIPKSMAFYPIDFANKGLVSDYLSMWDSEEDLTVKRHDFFSLEEKEDYVIKYKEEVLEQGEVKTVYRSSIKYTDSVELIINMINKMIEIITYALVVFTSIALLVSTVMIGIITYVSVVERVKEIGVIRSLGGRKKDVAHLFNAETIFIGFSSGIFGVFFTNIIALIANIIVANKSNGQIPQIAHLTWINALIMIGISVLLTTISGLIPAQAAARKNPVDALRTE